MLWLKTAKLVSRTWCTLFANSLCVMVQGRWWWPWKAAICLPSTGVLASPGGGGVDVDVGGGGEEHTDNTYMISTCG